MASLIIAKVLVSVSHLSGVHNHTGLLSTVLLQDMADADKDRVAKMKADMPPVPKQAKPAKVNKANKVPRAKSAYMVRSARCCLLKAFWASGNCVTSSQKQLLQQSCSKWTDHVRYHVKDQHLTSHVVISMWPKSKEFLSVPASLKFLLVCT